MPFNGVNRQPFMVQSVFHHPLVPLPRAHGETQVNHPPFFPRAPRGSKKFNHPLAPLPRAHRAHRENIPPLLPPVLPVVQKNSTTRSLRSLGHTGHTEKTFLPFFPPCSPCPPWFKKNITARSAHTGTRSTGENIPPPPFFPPRAPRVPRGSISSSFPS
jgi:hypothetical protein